MVTAVDHQGMSTSRETKYTSTPPKVNLVESFYFKVEITAVELGPWLYGRCLNDQSTKLYRSRKNIFTPFRPYNME
jgi:hypothetical protein